MKNLSVYIHIPFCKSKCAYCDFVSFKCNQDMVKSYIKALCKEIESFDASEYIVDSIFIGGGTPTYLDLQDFKNIIDCIKSNFTLDLCEFTVEGNPNSYTKEKVEFYKSQGVTRLSVGVQSLNDSVLKGIGRIHTARQAQDCLKILVESGLDINCDMMVGLPYQDLSIVKEDFEYIVTSGVSSVSCYSLILEEGTPLFDAVDSGKVSLPTQDQTVDMYDTAKDILEKAGLQRYEISNFGKPCLHNIGYWSLKEYIGFGLSAHSFIGNTRFYNTSDLKKYLDGQDKITEEVLSAEDMRKEYAMLSLRMDSGINISDYIDKFGVDGYQKLLNEIDNDKRFYDISDKAIAIKSEFIYMSNSLIANLI